MSGQRLPTGAPATEVRLVGWTCPLGHLTTRYETDEEPPSVCEAPKVRAPREQCGATPLTDIDLRRLGT